MHSSVGKLARFRARCRSRDDEKEVEEVTKKKDKNADGEYGEYGIALTGRTSKLQLNAVNMHVQLGHEVQSIPWQIE